MWFVADDPTAWDFDLSRHKSLRTLEVPVSIIVREEPGLLTRVLLTIASPVFSEVVFIYRDYNFGHINSPSCMGMGTGIIRGLLPDAAETEASTQRGHLEALREMHRVRDFQLVLCADVWERVREYAVLHLKRVVADEKVGMGADDFFSKLLVIPSPRESYPLYLERSSADWIIPGPRCKI